MTVDNVPCAVCGEPTYLDEPHARLAVEFRATGRREMEYVAHIECVDDLEEPEP